MYWAIRGLMSGDMRHLELHFILLLNLFQFNLEMVRRALVEVLYFHPPFDRQPSYRERHQNARHP